VIGAFLLGVFALVRLVDMVSPIPNLSGFFALFGAFADPPGIDRRLRDRGRPVHRSGVRGGAGVGRR
jgi:hypothetical protein